MPELPEVETVRTALVVTVVGRTINQVSFGDFEQVMGDLRRDDVNARLVNRKIVAIGRRGKYLIVQLDDEQCLLIHLRMTGRLLVIPRIAPPIRFQRLAIRLDNGTDLRFGDQRKFGRVLLVEQADVAALDARLGPEPLSRTYTADQLWQSLQRRTGKLKNVLLDQQFVAGLGNIYVDEALFRSRLHPLRVSASLDRGEAAHLHRSIRAVLRQAISNQGTTFSSFENPYGEQGGNANALQVYGKGHMGTACPRCSSSLRRLVVGGRGTTFCPTCQPTPL